jgi:hypothetical protein
MIDVRCYSNVVRRGNHEEALYLSPTKLRHFHRRPRGARNHLGKREDLQTPNSSLLGTWFS